MDKVKDEPIWIGDVDDLDEDDLSQFDFILNLSSWCDSKLAHKNSYAHISIADGKDSYKDFETAVDPLWNRYKKTEDDILVNCAAGISRSIAVATTVVALRRGTSFEEELVRVRSSRGVQQDPHPALKNYGKRYIAEHKEGDTR